MDFVILFGPPAVGKMTVGQSLARLTGYKLLHNHMTIDLVREFFDFGTPQFENLVPSFRKMIVSEAAASDLSGLIFTFVWDFSQDRDKIFLDELAACVASHGGRTLYAELEAGVDERVRRNNTDHRERHKPRRIADERIVAWNETAVLNTSDNFPYPDRHVKIVNDAVSAADAAKRIQAALGLLSVA